MKLKDLPISLSAIDAERFGIKTAKVENIELHDIPNVMRFCEENDVRLLLTRCPTSDLPAVQELERKGFLLMDTLIYYLCNLRENPPPEYVSEIRIRSFIPGEEKIIKAIAAEAFDGYLGHYHSDSRLDKTKCNETYADWAYKSCLRKEVAVQVFVAELKENIIGFGTVRENSPDEGQGILFGVLKPYQGMGIYRMIMTNYMKWCVERNIGTIIISTQIANLASQKVWIRLGFDPGCSYYTFHKWFAENS
ncbi:MAG: GNAT family N-acetyltransferase [Smithella sp.]